MSVTRLLDRVGAAVDRWGTGRVLLSLVAAFHLGFALAFAVLPSYLLASPSLGVLFRGPGARGMWGVVYGLVGGLAVLELALPAPVRVRARRLLTSALWLLCLPLTAVWTVGLALPCLPMFGGVGNLLGLITWGGVLLPLWGYTMRLTTGAGACGLHY